MSTVTLAEVKDELRKSGVITVDDAKIQRFIDAAEAEYVEWVGPITGSVTEILNGGSDVLLLRDPRASAITAASYESGETLTYTELNVHNGMVRWNYNTAGRFSPVRVSITYTVGALPANHREDIVADVCGYFQNTQNGSAGRPQIPGLEDGLYERARAYMPLALFPRIRAIVGSGIA